MKAVIDGDMLAYKIGFSCEVETEWTNDIWTLHTNLAEMKREVHVFLDKIQAKLGVDDFHIVFSPRTNFRYRLMPSYKAGRKGKRKPMGLKPLKRWVLEQFDGELAQDMEADDLIGIICTRDPEDTIAVSGDKDFATLPITWFNHMKDITLRTTPEQAKYNHLVQTLAGDPVDGYAGVKGVGVKTAKKILDKGEPTWDTVVAAYEKADMTEEEALLNARMAYILHDKDYNRITKEIKLWQPS